MEHDDDIDIDGGHAWDADPSGPDEPCCLYCLVSMGEFRRYGDPCQEGS